MITLAPLFPGLAEPADNSSDCGCCTGITLETPVSSINRPGLATITYRPGRYADFKRSQLARLSAEENPALAKLKSRDDADFTISLIDAWSCVCDVLAFYQERNAHEAWLGTATERESIVELGRLIGYRLRPGLAAATDLVFLMDNPAGASAAVAAVEIPVGTRVQSVPGPGETAQTFETAEPIEARVVWNALQPRLTRLALPQNGDREMWVEGISTGLKVGDLLLIVGPSRLAFPDSDQWNVRRLTRVEADPAANRTQLSWTVPLDAFDPGDGGTEPPQIFALRERTSLFGWNAPHPKLLSQEVRSRYGFENGEEDDWSFTIEADIRRVDLDGLRERFIGGSWVVLTRPPNIAKAYRIEAAVDDGASNYSISARATRLTLDTSNGLSGFDDDQYRRVSVYGASEALMLAEAPILEPVMGSAIELRGQVEGLAEGRRLIVRGRRAQVIAQEALELSPDGGSEPAFSVGAGTRLTILSAPVQLSEPSAVTYVWHLRAPGGAVGYATAPASAFFYCAADATAELIAEAATLSIIDTADATHDRVQLTAALSAVFDRATTVVHANVAPATHGEMTQEIIGNGDAARAFQSMRLRQMPLTHVSAATETGFTSTLRLRVNDVEWHEVATLYGQPPNARVFETRTYDDGTTVIHFGDGVTGARPPTGRNNLVATYRKGIGAAGSVAAGALTTALDRPLGLRDVFNPLPATGGQDPETLETARSNAPITTLTLGRVVSLRNYEDFARGFAGIAKARADVVWDGAARRIVVTVAGPGGEPVDPSLSNVHGNLVHALRNLGDPFVRISVVSYRKAFFRLKARLIIHPDHNAKIVLAAVETALRESYSFERRGFTPLLAASEVISVIHAVPGIEGVDLDLLYRTTGPSSAVMLHQRLLAEPVSLANNGTLLAAEILTLDPAPLMLEPIS